MTTIVPLLSSMTGLNNYNLTGQSKFDKNIGNLLNTFLSCLPSPVCLVAHNGSQYDFPLLKAEMEKAGTMLGSEILCVHSYLGIRSILKNSQQIESELEAVDTVMMEDTCAQIKTYIGSDRVKHLPCSSKTLQGNLIHQEDDHSMSALSVSTVSQ